MNSYLQSLAVSLVVLMFGVLIVAVIVGVILLFSFNLTLGYLLLAIVMFGGLWAIVHSSIKNRP